MSKKLYFITQSEDEIREIVKISKSYREVTKKLGFINAKPAVVDAVKRKIKSLGLDCSHFKNQRWSLGRRKEQLIQAVKNNDTLAGVLRDLDLNSTGGGSYQNIQKLIQELELDISHFKGQGWSKGIYTDLPKLRTSYKRREYMIRKYGYACKECGISEWRGNELTLELDHTDGNRNNNLEENLRILCPNCHSQTPTFKNKRRN